MAGPMIMSNGAIIECSEGGSPTPLKGIPQNRVMGKMGPIANIMDNKGFANIGPFGTCGVIKPPVCLAPISGKPWSDGSTSIMIGGQPALTKDSKCNCSLGGEISFTFEGAHQSKQG